MSIHQIIQTISHVLLVWFLANSSVTWALQDTVVEVVVEGSGLSLEEAQLDAYRQAVRAVVGMYVDSKTIVENDLLIEEQILSASNGFVKKVTTVPGSAKERNGIWKVRVNATVALTELSQRLQKENVTIKKLDGESMFAQAITQIDFRDNSNEILHSLLKDVPEMLKANVIGKPEYNSDKLQLEYQIRLEPDAEAYWSFLPRLTQALDKISTSKSKMNTVVAEPVPSFDGLYYMPVMQSTDDRTKPTQCMVTILNSWNNKHTRLRWTTYVVEIGSIKGSILTLEGEHWAQSLSRRWTSGDYTYPRMDLKVVAKFINELGEVEFTDSWIVNCDPYYASHQGLLQSKKPVSGVPNLLITPLSRETNTEVDGKPLAEFSRWAHTGDHREWNNFAFAIAPIFMTGRSPSGMLMHESMILNREIEFDLDVLRNVKEIQIELESVVPK